MAPVLLLASKCMVLLAWACTAGQVLPRSRAHGVCCLPCEASQQGKILNVAADLRTLLQQQGLVFEEQARAGAPPN